MRLQQDTKGTKFITVPKPLCDLWSWIRGDRFIWIQDTKGNLILRKIPEIKVKQEEDK